MTIEQLIKQDSRSSSAKRVNQPILLKSRIRLARNLEGYWFPGWSKPDQRMKVYDRCREAIESIPQFNPCIHFSIEALDTMERQFLVERHLISKELSEGNSGAGVTINDSQLVSIMINEEDHLRIQVMASDLAFDELWEQSDAIDNELEKHIDYVYRSKFGYLTACPTNLGTGMRASAMLHLPALVMTKQMEKVIRAVNQLGIVARGTFGESSDPSGSIFQISNQQTLGESEKEIINRLQNVIQSIIEQESNARIRLFENEGNQVLDRVFRAFGVLRYANVLNSAEAMNLLSMLRLASDIRLLPENVRGLVDRLMMDTQPSHLQFGYGGILDADKRDILRAEKIRKEMENLPDPDPGNLDFSNYKASESDEINTKASRGSMEDLA